MRLRWQDDAITDLHQLRAYIAQDNPSAAARVARRIQQATSRLIDQPAWGRPGRIPDTRELVIPNTPYIVTYRITGTTVTILRMLHAARRWPETC